MGGQLTTSETIYVLSAGVIAADSAGMSSVKSYSALLTSIAALPLAGGTLIGNLLFTDNTYTIGAAGATRPSAVHIGTGGIATAGDITITNSVSSTTPAVLTLNAWGTNSSWRTESNYNGGAGATWAVMSSNTGYTPLSANASTLTLTTQGKFIATDTITCSATQKLGVYTVATLPSAAANAYHEASVSDSSVDVAGNFGATVAGGGSYKVKLFCNGTNWVIA